MSDGAIKIAPLITHKFDFDDAVLAYEQLSNPMALGVVLGYGSKANHEKQNGVCGVAEKNYAADTGVCGFLGGGNYASRVLIPAFESGSRDGVAGYQSRSELSFSRKKARV